MDWNTLIALASFVGGVIASAITCLKWYGNSQKKAYAAERDFQHLRRNYEQLAEAIKQVDHEVEQININLVRLEGLILRNHSN